jgi:hypothetical protein
MAIAQSGDRFVIELQRQIAVIDDNEVIAGTVHFVKVE